MGISIYKIQIELVNDKKNKYFDPIKQLSNFKYTLNENKHKLIKM